MSSIRKSIEHKNGHGYGRMVDRHWRLKHICHVVKLAESYPYIIQWTLNIDKSRPLMVVICDLLRVTDIESVCMCVSRPDWSFLIQTDSVIEPSHT